MKPAQSLLSPNNNKALVRFMRPSGFGFAINFNVLDGEKVIGNSVAKSQFDYLADPGKHLFITTAENKAFLEAELEGGKTYYVITRIYPGVMFARVTFIAVNKGTEFWGKVLEYENTLVKLEPDIEVLKHWEESNKPKIQKVLSSYESIWKEKHQWPKLSPEDGR
tara:strand:+ start:92 stop:586 length:495 start_codon:yes stop_codon:yes gene_type:complete